MRRVGVHAAGIAFASLVAALLAGPLLAQPTATAPPASGAPRAMIVIDASGSMLAPIGGRPKMEIAREALAELLKGWDPKVEVGLMAYGHRRKGDCTDIEVLASAGPIDAARLMGIVSGIQPKGMTPLSDAVKLAAQSLRFTEQSATVILISDGIETCKADPCALGAELKKLGVDFRTHVIGFDVQRHDEGGLRCLASATGGKYYAAKDAGALRDALRAAAGQAAGPTPPPPPPARPTANPLAGTPRPTLKPPLAAVTAGDIVSVAWTGPNHRGDHIGFAPPGGDAFGGYGAPTSGGNPLAIRAPEQPGKYDLIYVHQGTNKVLARTAMEVQAAKATLEAVETMTIGSAVDVTWTGPATQGDFITIVPPQSGPSAYRSYAYTDKGSPAKVRVPDTPGTYEIRYVASRTNLVLARRTVVALAAQSEIEAVASAPAGSRISIGWTGPNNPGDFITIVPPEAPKRTYHQYFYTNTTKPDAGSLPLPDKPGTYEIRYVTGQTNEIIGRHRIVAEALHATIEAPDSAPAGARIPVTWTGPNNAGDFITVVAPGAASSAYTSYFYTRTTRPDAGSLRLPDKPGTYEIRYITSQTTEVVTRRTIVLTAISATLEAPESVPPGLPIQVTWTGPNNEGDFVTVVKPEAANNVHGNYFYTRGAAPGASRPLDLPGELGTYELRYVTGQTNEVLARRPVAVVAFTVTLEAPDSVPRGQRITVKWTAPPIPGDFVTIVKPEAPDGAYTAYAYVANGSEHAFIAPDEPGTYEVRYVVAATKKVLARKVIEVQ